MHYQSTQRVLDSPPDLSLAQRIIDLVPRLDKPGHHGFLIGQLPVQQFEELFFVVVKDEEQHPPRLATLQAYEPFDQGNRKWEPGEVLKPHHIPAKPTDMPRLDVFTKLAHAFGISEARRLQELLCPAEIDRFLCHYNEVSRPFEDRMDEVKERAWRGFIESEKGAAIMEKATGIVQFERDEEIN